MSLNVKTAAVRIRRELREAEARADEALLAKTRLMESLLMARQLPDVEVNTGQRALIRLARAIQSEVDGTTDLLRVHDEMVKVGQEMMILHEDTPESGLLDDDLLRVA